MSKQLTIVAQITARPEHFELVKKALIQLIAPTRAEEGCINYDLHQDLESKNLFFFYENWESREHWNAHRKTAHIQAYKEATEGMIEGVKLNLMSVVGGTT